LIQLVERRDFNHGGEFLFFAQMSAEEKNRVENFK
jgi:hypothetical protein